MKVISLSEAKTHLSSVIDDAINEPVLITRNGKAVAVLIAPEDSDDLERLLLSRSKHLTRILEQSRASLQAGQGLTHEQIWAHLEQKN